MQDVPRLLALGSKADRARNRREDAGLVGTWGPGWEDGVSRVVTDAADKVDRRKRLIGLGNAVVPQIPELIGRAILQHHQKEQT